MIVTFCLELLSNGSNTGKRAYADEQVGHQCPSNAFGSNCVVLDSFVSFRHRPLSAYECKTATECLYWRNDVVKEIQKKIGQINNCMVFLNLPFMV